MGIGQTHEVRQAMIVMVDEDGRIRAWGMQNGTATWIHMGVSTEGLSTAKIVLEGEFKRRTMPAGIDTTIEEILP